MNFSWEMVLELMEKGIEKEEIFFRQAKEYSPYYEQSFSDINQKQTNGSKLEINGFFRFGKIFGELLNVNDTEAPELKEYLFDILMHYLTEIDFRKGVSRREIYITKICQEVSVGNYGNIVADQFAQLQQNLQHGLSDLLLTQFQTGSSVLLFSGAIRLIFPDAIVYKNNLNIKQLLVYLGEREGKDVTRRYEMVKSLFLPLGYSLRVFYEHHFGVLGVNETLKLGDIEIF